MKAQIALAIALAISSSESYAEESRWFAIALAPDAAGWSAEPRADKKAAENEAFENCAKASQRPRECKVVFVPAGSCIAISKCTVGGHTTVWYAISPTLKEALDEVVLKPGAAHIDAKYCEDWLRGCPK